jgi:hypothetical protein
MVTDSAMEEKSKARKKLCNGKVFKWSTRFYSHQPQTPQEVQRCCLNTGYDCPQGNEKD